MVYKKVRLIMKSSKAPEKIYLSDFTDTTESVFYVKQDNTKKTDIEYTRTDAFIDNACEWWENELTYPSMTSEEIKWYKDKIEDFRKAMKE